MVYGINAAAGGTFPTTTSKIRLRVLGLRDSTLPLESGNYFRFGLLHCGCPLLEGPTSFLVYADGNGSQPALLAPNSTMRLDGYFLELLTGSANADPTRWLVEVAENYQGKPIESDWKVAAASVQLGFGSLAQYFPDLSYPMPTERNLIVKFDLRYSWPWILIFVVAYAVPSAGWLLYCAAGLARFQNIPLYVLAISFALTSCLEGVGTVGFSTQNSWRNAIDGFLYCIPDFVLFSGLWFAERHILYVISAYSILSIAATVSSWFALSFLVPQGNLKDWFAYRLWSGFRLSDQNGCTRDHPI